MTNLYRHFTLKNRGGSHAAVEQMRAVAPTMARNGRPLHIILVDGNQDRLEEQVRFY
ncbi:hypothetical protein LBW56_21005 [Ralstonia solanacearum]|uniref:hypothetical protein n=1 Tax=Ralstonia solanacearum TaxID=305 RepID=UPI001FFA737D|nr:hypothetical protein [Ralstonia solanacearum]MDB0529163.1 hypothetical protein [Ralstonia solanacearum]